MNAQHVRSAAVASALVVLAAGAAHAGTGTLRAVGNEPSWHADVTEKGIAFRTLEGEQVDISPLPEANVVGDTRSYSATVEGKPFSLSVSERLCVDAMSGMPHPVSVVVDWNGKEFSGCGGNPAELLHGEWRITELGETGVLAKSEPTITFGTDGSVSGSASCNRFRGSYTLTGESLGLSGLALTRMLCEAALIEQERSVVETLETTSHFEIDGEGRLVLLAGDKRLVASRKE